MRAALLLLLVASTAAADTLSDGDVYLIRADGWADVTCEKWTIDGRSLEHRKGTLYERVDFDVDGAKTASCTIALPYAATDDGIELDDKVLLYFDVRDCRAHTRARAKVASYLPVVAPIDVSSVLTSCK